VSYLAINDQHVRDDEEILLQDAQNVQHSRQPELMSYPNLPSRVYKDKHIAACLLPQNGQKK
jgi:hypothetical protein